MPAADDEFVPLAVWLTRDTGEAPKPDPAVTAAAAAAAVPEPAEIEALARELRLLRARLADVEEALAPPA